MSPTHVLEDEKMERRKEWDRMATNVEISVIGGDYAANTWTGELACAPVMVLVPEGIVSDRTTLEAGRIRDRVTTLLESHDVIVIRAVKWAVRFKAVPT